MRIWPRYQDTPRTILSTLFSAQFRLLPLSPALEMCCVRCSIRCIRSPRRTCSAPCVVCLTRTSSTCEASCRDATYEFKHALIRDAAYEALLKSRRKELHRLIAQTIREKFPALKDAQPEVLARHWAEAGDTKQLCGIGFASSRGAKLPCSEPLRYNLHQTEEFT